MRRFAEDTMVPVAKSRGEIYALLESWGCTDIGFFDRFAKGEAVLQFVWKHGEASYAAQFTIRLPNDEALRKRAVDGRTKRFSENKLQQLREARGRQEHRVLMLWIKAALNAVEAGIVDAEAIFLPWIISKDGRTVAEVLIPKLGELLTTSPDRLMIGR